MIEQNKPTGCKSGFNITEKIKLKDQIKSKILRFIIFKKRTENEVRKKFQNDYDQTILNEVIEELKTLNYINDENYIERYVNEALNTKTLSIVELKFKLQSKEISKKLIENYFKENYEKLYSYELNSVKKIFKKKSQKDLQSVKNYLFRKGYKTEIVKLVEEDFIEENND